MVDKRTEKKRVKEVRKRLRENRPEVIAKREINYNIQREMQRRTLASNAQSLHDRYVGEIQNNPMLAGLRLAGVQKHKNQLQSLLSEMNSFQDPRMGIPPY